MGSDEGRSFKIEKKLDDEQGAKYSLMMLGMGGMDGGSGLQISIIVVKLYWVKTGRRYKMIFQWDLEDPALQDYPFNRISIISFRDVQHIKSGSNLCSSILGNQSSFVLKRLCTETDIKGSIIPCLSKKASLKDKIGYTVVIYISIVKFLYSFFKDHLLNIFLVCSVCYEKVL